MIRPALFISPLLLTTAHASAVAERLAPANLYPAASSSKLKHDTFAILQEADQRSPPAQRRHQAMAVSRRRPSRFTSLHGPGRNATSSDSKCVFDIEKRSSLRQRFCCSFHQRLLHPQQRCQRLRTPPCGYDCNVERQRSISKHDREPQRLLYPQQCNG